MRDPYPCRVLQRAKGTRDTMEDLHTPSSPTIAHMPGGIMPGHPPRPPSMSMHRSKRSSSRINDGASSKYSDDDAKTAVKVGRWTCCAS